MHVYVLLSDAINTILLRFYQCSSQSFVTHLHDCIRLRVASPPPFFDVKCGRSHFMLASSTLAGPSSSCLFQLRRRVWEARGTLSSSFLATRFIIISFPIPIPSQELNPSRNTVNKVSTIPLLSCQLQPTQHDTCGCMEVPWANHRPPFIRAAAAVCLGYKLGHIRPPSSWHRSLRDFAVTWYGTVKFLCPFFGQSLTPEGKAIMIIGEEKERKELWATETWL